VPVISMVSPGATVPADTTAFGCGSTGATEPICGYDGKPSPSTPCADERRNWSRCAAGIALPCAPSRAAGSYAIAPASGPEVSRNDSTYVAARLAATILPAARNVAPARPVEFAFATAVGPAPANEPSLACLFSNHATPS